MAQYATIDEADDYFDEKLHCEMWANQSVSDRNKALKTATKYIDRLRFIGMKNPAYVYSLANPTADETDVFEAGQTQELEFPRGSDTEIPAEVKHACCEIAYALLDGRNPELDYEELTVTSQGFANVRNASDRQFQQGHTAAMIPSPLAWLFLRPYLRDVREVKVSRV